MSEEGPETSLGDWHGITHGKPPTWGTAMLTGRTGHGWTGLSPELHGDPNPASLKLGRVCRLLS